MATLIFIRICGGQRRRDHIGERQSVAPRHSLTDILRRTLSPQGPAPCGPWTHSSFAAIRVRARTGSSTTAWVTPTHPSLQSSPAPGAARAASQAGGLVVPLPRERHGVISASGSVPLPKSPPRCPLRAARRAQPQRDSHLQGALSGRTWLRQRKPGTAAARSAPRSPSS